MNELQKALIPLRERFDPKVRAEKQAELQEQRKADLEVLNDENERTKAEVEAEQLQIKQKHDAEHLA
jgi:hypothetical protein